MTDENTTDVPDEQDATGTRKSDDEHQKPDTGHGPVTTRRGVLMAGSVLGLLGIGAGTASADPSGQIGTSGDPLQDLYTETLHGHSGTLTLKDSLSLDGNKLTNAQSINGSVTGNTEITDLVGSGLTISSGSLQTSGGSTSKLETSGNTALEVFDASSTVSDAGSSIDTPNVVGGHPNNNTDSNTVKGVTISGGGSDTSPQKATARYTTIGGGYNIEVTSKQGTVSGGFLNKVSGLAGTVGGGKGNDAKKYATVGGGEDNQATSDHATVAGGNSNEASGLSASVLGGGSNDATGTRATIGGGYINEVSGDYATIPGGQYAEAASNYTFVLNDGDQYTNITNAGTDGLSSDNAVDGESVTGQRTFSAAAKNGFRLITGGSSNPSVVTVDDDGSDARLQTHSYGLKLKTNDNGNLTLDPGSNNELSLSNQSTTSSDDSLLAIDGSGNVKKASSTSLSDVGGSPSSLVTSSNSVTAVEVIDGNSSVTASSDTSTPPNVIGGHPSNNTGGDGVKGVTVFGGDKNPEFGPSLANTASADFATVGGGKTNTASAPGDSDIGPTVGGGIDNTADEGKATVAGGKSNTASGFAGTVGGGSFNEASGNSATVAGGSENTAGAKHASVAGGRFNTASADKATAASADNATVAGGFENTAGGKHATVPGGKRGAAEDNDSFVWNDGSGYHGIPNAQSNGLSSSTDVNGSGVTGDNTFHVSAENGFRFITGGSSNPSVVTVDDDGSDARLQTHSYGLQINTNDNGNLTLDPGSNNQVNMKGNLDLKGNNIECTSTLGTDFKALVDADGSGEDSQVSFIFPDKDTAEEIKWVRDALTDDAFRVRDTNNSNTLFTVNDGGNVDIQNGNLDVQGGTVENTTGGLTLSTSSNDLTLSPSGNVKLDSLASLDVDGNDITSTGGYTIEVTGTDNDLILDANNQVKLRTDLDFDLNHDIFANGTKAIGFDDGGVVSLPNIGTGSNNSLHIKSDGTIVEKTSSARFKTNIRDLSASTDRVLDLQPRTYEREDSGGQETGLIAEEVDEILPEIVTYDEDGAPYGVQYQNLGVFLVPEVDENRERITDIEDETSDLEADLDAKDARIDDQQDRIERLESTVDNKDVALDALREALDDKDQRMADLEAESADLRAENDQLRERNAELEDRLATVEAELGIDATASQQGVADD